MAGDFNLVPCALECLGTRALFRCSESTTRSNPIDNVVYRGSKKFEPLMHWVLRDVQGSDHFPIITDWAVKE